MAPEDEQLYVRINEQDEMLDNLERLQQIIENINEAAEILDQVREVKQTAIDTIFSNIKEMNESLDNFEMAMPEVDGQPQTHPDIPQDQGEQEDVEVESSVDEIHDELQDLQDELSRLGS